MIWTIITILLALWLIGIVAEIGGALVNILLVAALIVFIYNQLTKRRAQ